MARNGFTSPTNPYHYILHCLGGKWKMTLLHKIHTSGSIKFNQTLRSLPVTEKILSQQLKELCEDGLVRRVVDGYKYPPAVDYVLTKSGEELFPALDTLYSWSICQMEKQGIIIDTDSFPIHNPKNI